MSISNIRRTRTIAMTLSGSLLLSALSSHAVLAESNMAGMDHQQMNHQDMMTGTYPVHGVITAIDASQLQVTLKHDAVKALNWPAMTMPFRIENESLLNNLKVGQTINAQFKTEEGQSPVIVSIETK